MARIDRFAEALARSRGERVVVASGEQAVLHRGEMEKPITASALGRKLVDDVLKEVVPPELSDAIEQDGEHVFVHASEHGPIEVTVQRADGRLVLELRPASETDSPSPAPEPAREEAPQGATSSRAWAPSQSAPQPSAPEGREAPARPARAAGDTSVMDALFREMVENGCSDLHLSAQCPPLFRKDGAIQKLGSTDPIAPERLREMLYSITPETRRAEFEERHDSDFSYEIEGVGRFRCNLFLDRKGMGGVFRLIPVEILTAEQLGLSEHILQLCTLNKGLVVVTGPTGSGKSTTLAAMVDHINRTRSDHIITIEDPIEFVHDNQKCLVNQREIGSHTEGFQSALRAALREDPDIVLVGEMRDLETVEIAIETAETGHLVFGTLHTNTAASTVDRIIDQFPTSRQGQIRTMLSGSLRGVIAQTLCKKKGGGRAAALEVLIVNHAVANLIREGKTFQIPSIMQTGKKLGMVTLNEALLDLIQKGVVEPEQAYAKAVDPAEFAGLLKARGITLAVGTPPA